MPRYIIFCVLCFFIMIVPLTAEKYQLVKIVYLTPDALDEKVLLTKLDFKEGEYYSQQELDSSIELSLARLKYWNVFNEVLISVKDSTKTDNGKVVYIELYNGFDSLYDGGLFYFTCGKRNNRRRGDFSAYTIGLNRLMYEYKLHLGNPAWRFDQKIGYSFDIDDPFFPYYPLKKKDSLYIQHLETDIAINRLITPDATLALYLNPEIVFLNYHYPESFEWEMERKGVALGLRFAVNRDYLIMLYPLSFSLTCSYDWNFDLEGKNSYGEAQCGGEIKYKPLDSVVLRLSPNIKSKIGNDSIYEKYNLNSGQFFRGRIEDSPYIGNLVLYGNFDIQYRIAEFGSGGGSNSIGATLLYDITAVGDESLDDGFEHTIGGGLWYTIGIPVGIQIFGNYGYTLGETWAIKFGVETSY